jgi:hypothetical protein
LAAHITIVALLGVDFGYETKERAVGNYHTVGRMKGKLLVIGSAKDRPLVSKSTVA